VKSLELDKIYKHEEYFLLEEAGEVRHEFINGNLIEMSGASREHHFIVKISFWHFCMLSNLLALRFLLKA